MGMRRPQQMSEIVRQMGVTKAQAKKIYFYCARCADEPTCKLAWDAYNTYGEGVIDTGCLAEK